MDQWSQSLLERLMLLRTSMRRQYVTNHGKGFAMALARIHKLSLDGPVPVSKVAQDSGFSMAAATQWMNMLVRKGYLKKERSLDDARVFHVALTKEGLDAVQSAQRHVAKQIEKLCEYLGPSDTKELDRLIGRILDYNQNTASTQGELL